jgi:hypothetical protein
VLQWVFDPKLIEPLENVGLQVIGWDCCTNQHRRDYLMLAGYTSGRIDRAQAILQKQDASNEALARSSPTSSRKTRSASWSSTRSRTASGSALAAHSGAMLNRF